MRVKTYRERLGHVLKLSIPAILAQISSIIMQYIDAAMAGSLGAEATAAIGLVASTTWLFGGLCMAAAAGFSVQTAQLIGAGEQEGARRVLRQGLLCTFLFGLALAAVGISISSFLPLWLGGEGETARALRGAGDTLIPSILNLASMWGVRITLSLLLAPRLGLAGVWLAMCVELCVRGVLFLIRLFRGKWLTGRLV